MVSASHGLFCYAWDLAELELADFAVDLEGIGIDTIALATAYHAGKFLRPHGVEGKIHFPEDGVIYFDHDPSRYGRLKPQPWSGLADGDPFDRLKSAAPDLKRVAWVVACHNTRMGQAYPDTVARNAFGDPYIYNLNPAHPEVRDYVIALCSDVAQRHDLAAVSIETPGWLAFEHGYHHEFYLRPVDRWLSLLLGIDFSPETIRAAGEAGIDAEPLRRQAAAWIERHLAAELVVEPERAQDWIAADMLGDPDWAAFLRWRCECVTELCAEIKDALPRGTDLRIIPSVIRPSARGWIEGSDLAGLSRVVDRLDVCTYEPSAEALAVDVFDIRRRIGDDAALAAVMRPGWPDLGAGRETAQAAAALKAARVEGMSFYNYGHLGLAALERIREAIEVFES